MEIQLPKKALFLLTEKSRYKVLYGGRSSGKSHSVARCLLLKALEKKSRILCTRQIQSSIKDSVKKLLDDCIHSMGFDRFFVSTQDSIRCVNGSEFIFKGLKMNISEIRSMEGINYCWVEEADSVTEESWDNLKPTIRAEGSEIWVTFNPNLKSDATYQMFVEKPDKDCISVQMNYTDNPFITQAALNEMQSCKEINYPKYQHIWLGMPNTESGNLIKMSKFKRYTTPPSRFNRVYICCDTAFSEKKSADDTAFMLIGIDGKDKYILDVYSKNVTFVDLKRDLLSFYLQAKEKYGKTSPFTGVYIENKASGISLIQQLRSEGIPVSEINPTVHNSALKREVVADKYTRFLEIESELDSGFVWLPEYASFMPELTVQFEGFKGGKQETNDGIVDCLIYCLKQAQRSVEPDWNEFRKAFRI